MAINARAAQAPPKPCSFLMHTFEPPPGYKFARGTAYNGMVYFYEDGSIVAIYPPSAEEKP